RPPEARLDRPDYTHGNLVLKRENIFQDPIVLLSPQIGVGFRIDQLYGNTDSIARLAHAALKHVANTKFIRHLLNSDRLILVGKSRVAGGHRQPFDTRESSDDLIYHAI